MDQLSEVQTEALWSRGRVSSGRPPTAGRGASPLPVACPQIGQPLAFAIEHDIVPRLVLAHCDEAGARTLGAVGLGTVDGSDVDALLAALLWHDAAATSAAVERTRSRGVDIETIFLDLFAPAARRLGVLWEEDICDFASVSVCLWRLRNMFRDLAGEITHRPPLPNRRLLLAVLPGEQHNFGAQMLGEFFRRARWGVSNDPLETMQDLSARVRREWFSMVGLSVGSARKLDALASAIRAIRRLSRNPAIGVMVGGAAFIDHPEFVRLVGADTTAADAESAPRQAENLISVLAAAR